MPHPLVANHHTIADAKTSDYNTGINLMSAKTRIWIWLVFLGVLDALIPLFPIVTLILIYVLMERPRWFIEWVEEIYKPL